MKVGWSFFLLAAIALAAYALNRGIYVGSDPGQTSADGITCYYLFPSGVVDQSYAAYCPPSFQKVPAMSRWAHGVLPTKLPSSAAAVIVDASLPA